ncbi:MAG: biotin/lipoyl-containing protein [Bacteroidota bacterium]
MLAQWLRSFFLGDTAEKVAREFPRNPSKIESPRTGSPISKPAELIQDSVVERGTIQVLKVPDLGKGDNYRITKWHVEIGQIIQKGDFICDVENRHYLMECESLYTGRLITRNLNATKLAVNEELCRIEIL